MLTREQLIKEARGRGGNFVTLVGIYAVILATLALTASAIV